VAASGQVTVITGEFDQAALHGLLERDQIARSRAPGGPPVTRHTYEIRVIGSLGPAAREAFVDMMVEIEPTITVLSGDQAGADRAVGLTADARFYPQFLPPVSRVNSISSRPSA
jgi:hypothetical protein